MNNKYILITGAAGFIGFHLSLRLCQEGYYVLGIDNLNTYYDVNLKKDRLKILKDKFSDKFCFKKVDITDMESLQLLQSDFEICNVM